MKKIFLFSLLLFSLGVFAKPYHHSLGVSMGNFDGFSWKVLATEHFAVQTDCGFHLTVYDDLYGTFLVNPNFMYQGTMWSNHICSIDWFIGTGTSLGLATNELGYENKEYNDNIGGFFGANGILGIEFAFSKALALSFDFRPGYGLYFGDVRKNGYSSTYHYSKYGGYYDYTYYTYTDFALKHIFDWGVNLGLRFYI